MRKSTDSFEKSRVSMFSYFHSYWLDLAHQGLKGKLLHVGKPSDGKTVEPVLFIRQGNYQTMFMTKVHLDIPPHFPSDSRFDCPRQGPH